MKGEYRVGIMETTVAALNHPNISACCWVCGLRDIIPYMHKIRRGCYLCDGCYWGVGR